MQTKQDIGFNRENALTDGALLLKKIGRRLSAERYKEQNTDPGFIKMLKAYCVLLGTLNTISRDAELQELEARLTALEANNAGAPTSLLYDGGEDESTSR